MNTGDVYWLHGFLLVYKAYRLGSIDRICNIDARSVPCYGYFILLCCGSTFRSSSSHCNTRPVGEVFPAVGHNFLLISPELLKCYQTLKIGLLRLSLCGLAIGCMVLMKMVVKSKNNGNVQALLLELGVLVVARLLNTY